MSLRPFADLLFLLLHAMEGDLAPTWFTGPLVDSSPLYVSPLRLRDGCHMPLSTLYLICLPVPLQRLLLKLLYALQGHSSSHNVPLQAYRDMDISVKPSIYLLCLLL